MALILFLMELCGISLVTVSGLLGLKVLKYIALLSLIEGDHP
jgi:uncharacterized protein YebE (UPF0316 family)